MLSLGDPIFSLVQLTRCSERKAKQQTFPQLVMYFFDEFHSMIRNLFLKQSRTNAFKETITPPCPFRRTPVKSSLRLHGDTTDKLEPVTMEPWV